MLSASALRVKRKKGFWGAEGREALEEPAGSGQPEKRAGSGELGKGRVDGGASWRLVSRANHVIRGLELSVPQP